MSTILYSIILYLQNFSSHFTSPGFFRPCQLANLKDERIQDKGNVLSFAKKWIRSRIILGHLYALFDGCASCHPFRRFFKRYRFGGFNVSGRFWKMLHGVDFHRFKIDWDVDSLGKQPSVSWARACKWRQVECMIFAFKLKWWKESKCSQIWAVAASHSIPVFPSMSYTSAHPMSIYQQVWIIQNLAKVQLLRPGFNKSDDDPHMCHEKNLRHAMQSLSPMARSVQTSKGAYWCPTVKLSLGSLLVYPKEISFPFTSISKDQVKRLQCLRSRWWKKKKNSPKIWSWHHLESYIRLYRWILTKIECEPNISWPNHQTHAIAKAQRISRARAMLILSCTVQ